ncbi:hypothetical protein ElyMa_002707400 [Elysia marginata]|uniref:Uncharacterized protein n=1 Tax=Elysia marginata TaxID=1093978 RepID=A0AAV4HDY9_9GAST|nr:hypothetical protein ElyMa_002707400 [Elysia marginata]
MDIPAPVISLDMAAGIRRRRWTLAACVTQRWGGKEVVFAQQLAARSRLLGLPEASLHQRLEVFGEDPDYKTWCHELLELDKLSAHLSHHT